MRAKLMGLLKDEEGQGMVEYGLIIGLISVSAIAILVLMGPKITAYFKAANDAM